MQSKSRVFPVRRILDLSALLFAGALLWLASPAVRAQTVAGYSGSGQVITGIVSKGAGQADITITGVTLKSTLSYCLVGVGRGNWHAKKIEGVDRFDLTKVACAKPASNAVTVTLKLANYEGGRIIGYVPVAVDASGTFVDWQPKPIGSQEFERNNGKKEQVIPVLWSSAGIAQLATAEQASAIND